VVSAGLLALYVEQSGRRPQPPLDSGYPLGSESCPGAASRMDEGGCAKVAITGSPAQSRPSSASPPILGALPAQECQRLPGIPRSGLQECSGSQMSFWTARA